MSESLRLGIDIGGTKTQAALVDAEGALATRSAPSGRGPQEVVRTAVGLAHAVLDAAGVTSRGDIAGVSRADRPIASVGACMPGLVDPVSGTVRHAVNLGVESVDLAGELGRALGMAVAVENDVKAAALGAWRLRSASASGGSGGGSVASGQALAYLNLGTGLASAVVRDGEVVRGIDGVAGEVGHLPVGGDAPCSCGQVGCLETVASGSALARLWPESRRTVRDPFVAAREGDVVAAAAVDVLCTGIGLAIQLVALASGAEYVVIGGGLAALGDPLREGIRTDLTRRASSSQIIESLHLARRFELLPADVPVAAMGAAWLGRATVGAGPAAKGHLDAQGADCIPRGGRPGGLDDAASEKVG